MLGTGSFGQICQAVEDVMHDGRPLYFGDKSGPIEVIGRVVTTGPGWAYLRIAEGCDNWCAFCAIPAIRGRYRSRTLDAIVQEARDKGALIDATYGRRTRAVIFMDSDHVILSAVQPETVANRLAVDDVEDDEEMDNE